METVTRQPPNGTACEPAESGPTYMVADAEGVAEGVDSVEAVAEGVDGALAAAEIIQHLGARPQVALKTLAAQNGLTL